MTAPAPLEFTGERMIPEAGFGEIYWEHVYRYRFALPYGKGRAVLDIACGEGYGTAALQAGGAATVMGVDVSPEAVAHARAKYGIDARVGSAEHIPLGDDTVDVIVSFETIEHVADPRQFLDECARVLRRHGTLLISTPNKSVYQHEYPTQNPFHVSEMDFPSFCRVLGEKFLIRKVFSQRPRHAAPWSPRWWATDRPASTLFPRAEKLRASLRRKLCPGVERVAPEGGGAKVLEHVLATDRAGAAWVNEFTVRPAARIFDDSPTYYLAVAEKR